jgi:multidrug efflux pump subunit AcrA (membrane-fusion protein)
MKKHRYLLTLLAFSLAILLGACDSLPQASDASTGDQVGSESRMVDRSEMVSATGKVIPEREALLSVSADGVVEDVLVEKGDRVEAGDILVALEGTEQQLAAVSAAELALVNAQFALDSLYKDTDLQAAEALRSAEIAEQDLEDLYNSEVREAQALRAVAEAQKNYDYTEKNLAYLTKTPSQSAIDQAYANMLLAENKLNKVIEDVEEAEKDLKKYQEFQMIAKILRQALKGLEIQRTQAQLKYNDSVTKYNDLLSPPDPIDLSVAEAAYSKAQAQLDQAQIDLARVQDGPDAGDVALLQAQIEKGNRDYETYSAGPDPEDVALAEARIANAEAQVAAAKSVLSDLQLAAPFDGVISQVYIHESEWVAPGSPVLLIADLGNLQVETTDLGEIDVAKITVGDRAVVTFDALPDLSLEGRVVSIAPKADEGPGVNYPVVLELSEIPASLRWGMTAFVDIEK